MERICTGMVERVIGALYQSDLEMMLCMFSLTAKPACESWDCEVEDIVDDM